ncbi:hypothetical protein Bca4012_009864 [Brassica carinata]|uniref:Peptidase C19 ubiquitin carboxyl-terminal hydrolase domain-containing protein n=1 Tax=Brassica carinata TaxID=52824 RepID=A0A8X7S2I1_BRACI|nr:hypothetical protein Bca52824_035090 [Brassica carinata]
MAIGGLNRTQWLVPWSSPASASPIPSPRFQLVVVTDSRLWLLDDPPLLHFTSDFSFTASCPVLRFEGDGFLTGAKSQSVDLLQPPIDSEICVARLSLQVYETNLAGCGVELNPVFMFGLWRVWVRTSLGKSKKSYLRNSRDYPHQESFLCLESSKTTVSMETLGVSDLELDVQACSDVYASLDKLVNEGKLFNTLPPLLFFQLNRFNSHCNQEQADKVNQRYEYPCEIHLGKFVTIDADGTDQFTYKLKRLQNRWLQCENGGQEQSF